MQTISRRVGRLPLAFILALAALAGIFGNGTAIVDVKTDTTPRWVTPSSVPAPVKLY